jgi:hypothetical protein
MIRLKFKKIIFKLKINLIFKVLISKKKNLVELQFKNKILILKILLIEKTRLLIKLILKDLVEKIHQIINRIKYFKVKIKIKNKHQIFLIFTTSQLPHKRQK